MKRKIMAILLAGGIFIVGTGAYAATNNDTTTGLGTIVCPYVGDRLKELTEVLRAKGKDNIADRIETGEYNNRREAITAVPEETEEITGVLQEEGLAGGGLGQNAGQGLADGTGNPNAGMGNGAGQGLADGTGVRKLDGTGNPNAGMGNGTGQGAGQGAGQGMGRNR